ncbi:MAG: hypothetical protein MJ137_00160 [Clostridia bacterium]|nr:hypothetical protein [Clostridia bacterium]
MKKAIAFIAAVILTVSVFGVFSGAVSESDFSDPKFTLLMQCASGVNYTDDDILLEGKYCMRGFTVSPDGKHLFGGILNPNGAGAVVRFDTETGHAGAYWYYEQTEGEKVGTRSYPKGLDCDDRGYLYVGLAYNPNAVRAYLAVVKTDEIKDDLMKTESVVPVLVDENNSKVGVNGVAVKAIGGKYYCYVVINYNEDYLYRFDVTTPEAPALDTSFGIGGRIDLQKISTASSGDVTEGNYLDIDDDGTIYIAYTAQNGAGLLKLSEDGNSVLGEVSQATGYAVAVVEDYVLCASQKAGSEIVVYDKQTLDKKASMTITENNIVLPYDEKYNLAFVDPINSIVGMRYHGGVLYLGDQGSGTSDQEQIFAIGLTDEGKATVKAAAAVLEGVAKALKDNVTTAAATTEAVTTAPAVTETTSPATDDTSAPAESTASGTAAPEVTTASSSAEKKGCGSFAALSVIPAAVLGCAFIRRRED